jgi:choline dehydrogenase-like flavoprotein
MDQEQTTMPRNSYEFLIVGSGAGGATLARELSRRGKRVLVLECGRRETSVGTYRDSLRYYDRSRWTKRAARSKEGVILWRACMAGGSTMVATGSATRCLEQELAARGIGLDEELAEAERDTKPAPIPQKLLSEASLTIMSAAQALGYRMQPIPKFIDPSKCRRCGQCTMGCAYGAKWSALEYLDEAIENGADVVYNTRARRVVVENRRARGVIATDPQGGIEYSSDTVILAGGALGTPLILQASGVEAAGSGLFGDLYIVTNGLIKGLHRTEEPASPLVDLEFHESKGFILRCPYVLPRKAKLLSIGSRRIWLPTYRLVGIMTKIADEAVGRVYPDGSVSKSATERDWTRLREGSSIARDILVEAGANPRFIVTSRPMAANLGGTAAIGRVVDRDLQTAVGGLFVCDGSVLPEAPGMPPVLTIIALAKRLAKALA